MRNQTPQLSQVGSGVSAAPVDQFYRPENRVSREEVELGELARGLSSVSAEVGKIADRNLGQMAAASEAQRQTAIEIEAAKHKNIAAFNEAQRKGLIPEGASPYEMIQIRRLIATNQASQSALAQESRVLEGDLSLLPDASQVSEQVKAGILEGFNPEDDPEAFAAANRVATEQALRLGGVHSDNLVRMNRETKLVSIKDAALNAMNVLNPEGPPDPSAVSASVASIQTLLDDNALVSANPRPGNESVVDSIRQYALQTGDIEGAREVLNKLTTRNGAKLIDTAYAQDKMGEAEAFIQNKRERDVAGAIASHNQKRAADVDAMKDSMAIFLAGRDPLKAFQSGEIQAFMASFPQDVQFELLQTFGSIRSIYSETESALDQRGFNARRAAALSSTDGALASVGEWLQKGQLTPARLSSVLLSLAENGNVEGAKQVKEMVDMVNSGQTPKETDRDTYAELSILASSGALTVKDVIRASASLKEADYNHFFTLALKPVKTDAGVTSYGVPGDLLGMLLSHAVSTDKLYEYDVESGDTAALEAAVRGKYQAASYELETGMQTWLRGNPSAASDPLMVSKYRDEYAKRLAVVYGGDSATMESLQSKRVSDDAKAKAEAAAKQKAEEEAAKLKEAQSQTVPTTGEQNESVFLSRLEDAKKGLVPEGFRPYDDNPQSRTTVFNPDTGTYDYRSVAEIQNISIPVTYPRPETKDLFYEKKYINDLAQTNKPEAIRRILQMSSNHFIPGDPYSLTADGRRDQVTGAVLFFSLSDDPSTRLDKIAKIASNLGMNNDQFNVFRNAQYRAFERAKLAEAYYGTGQSAIRGRVSEAERAAERAGSVPVSIFP